MKAMELIEALEGNLDGDVVIEVPLERGKLVCEIERVDIRKRESHFGEPITQIYIKTEQT